MNSISTIDLLDSSPTAQTPSTVFSYEEDETHHDKVLGLWRAAKVAGLALSLVVSSLTAIPDPWLIERKRRDATITMSIYQDVIGRPVTRAEALRIARQILEQAEQERLAIADFEAARGIQWGDES